MVAPLDIVLIALAGRALTFHGSGAGCDFPAAEPSARVWPGLCVRVLFPHQRNATPARAVVPGLSLLGHPSRSGVHRAAVGLQPAPSAATGRRRARHRCVGPWRTDRLSG